MSRVILLIGGALALAAAVPLTTLAQPSKEVMAEFLADPLLFYADQRQEAIIECASWMLEGPEAKQYSWPQQRQALTTLAAVYVSTGKMPAARAACRGILESEPCSELDQTLRLPPPLLRLFYGLRDSVVSEMVKVCPNEIQTIAVGDIENDTSDPALDSFCKGLSQIIATDLLDTTPLRVVDRVRLQVFMDEIGMSKGSQITDPKFAVPTGKVMGAQSFLFGNLIALDKKKVMVVLRWVNTSTTEILLSARFEARSDSREEIVKLEQKLLVETLLPQVCEMLGESVEKEALEEKAKSYLKSKQQATGSDYITYLLRTGDAVLATLRGDMEQAQKMWHAVSELNPADTVAKSRAVTLRAQRGLEEKS